MSAAWEAWLAECLGALDIDADVFGPYVTGIMEDETQQEAERASSVLDLLVDASPSGTVADGTVERLTQRWHERVSGEAAAATAASNAVLAKFAAEAAAQRAADAEFAASRQARQAEEAENKRAVIAQLDAAASSEDEDDGGDDDDDDLGGGAPSRPAATAELERARQEAQRAAADRRAAIKLAVEREDRKKAEHDARRLIREQAGHTNSKASAKGRGAGDAKGDAKRK